MSSLACSATVQGACLGTDTSPVTDGISMIGNVLSHAFTLSGAGEPSTVMLQDVM